MTPITKKIRSASGSSMPLALLFLLFCLAVGGVVLTAASANAGRLARLKVEQQDYLAVQSAARLMRDDLQKLEFTGSYTETSVATTTITPSENPNEPPTVTQTTTEPTYGNVKAGFTVGNLLQLLDADSKRLYQSTPPLKGTAYAPTPHYLTITAAVGMPEVTAKLILQGDYTIVAELAGGSASNSMTLKISPKKVETSSTTTTETDEATTTATIYTTTTATTYTTSVTYPDAVITKGGAA
ncbi:MAG: hypothetical protein RR336_03590 [Oscillospiraceae bacterium]